MTMSVPMEQMDEPETMASEQAEQTGQMLSEEDEQDIDIAIAAALKMIDTPEGEQMLQKIMSSPNPMPALVVFLFKMMEAVMMGEGGDEINPAVWFAEGGVLDDMTDELDQISGADITSIMPDIKQMLLEKIKKMAPVAQEMFKDGGQEQPMEEAPQGPRRPPPVLGTPGV